MRHLTKFPLYMYMYTRIEYNIMSSEIYKFSVWVLVPTHCPPVWAALLELVGGRRDWRPTSFPSRPPVHPLMVAPSPPYPPGPETVQGQGNNRMAQLEERADHFVKLYKRNVCVYSCTWLYMCVHGIYFCYMCMYTGTVEPHLKTTSETRPPHKKDHIFTVPFFPVLYAYILSPSNKTKMFHN